MSDSKYLRLSGLSLASNSLCGTESPVLQCCWQLWMHRYTKTHSPTVLWPVVDWSLILKTARLILVLRISMWVTHIFIQYHTILVQLLTIFYMHVYVWRWITHKDNCQIKTKSYLDETVFKKSIPIGRIFLSHKSASIWKQKKKKDLFCKER